LSDVEWRNDHGHYEVCIGHYPDDAQCEWITVPDDAVIKGPNRDGRATVWPIWGTTPKIRCFMPGVLT
jgi:hypothetical protein